MSVNCDVILREGAMPEELADLGAALWRWCNRARGDTNVFHHLDNQPLADLIAGKLPFSSRLAPQPGFHFWIRDEASTDRGETIDSLRQDLPGIGIEDILVDGLSWKQV